MNYQYNLSFKQNTHFPQRKSKIQMLEDRIKELEAKVQKLEMKLETQNKHKTTKMIWEKTDVKTDIKTDVPSNSYFSKPFSATPFYASPWSPPKLPTLPQFPDGIGSTDLFSMQTGSNSLATDTLQAHL
jgi:hypothetical protein